VLLGRRIGLVGPGGASQPKDENLVRDLEDVDEVVADHHDPEIALFQAFDQVEHLLGLGDSERSRRLVEQHHLRLAQQ
jgi:hypothetical protein